MFSSMAKKSYKQRGKFEEVQISCMSGLIRVFDFRHNHKFLTDGIHGINRYLGRSDLKSSKDLNGINFVDNDEGHRSEYVYVGRPSIKALMEEEMANSTQPMKKTERSIFEVCSNKKSVNMHEGSEIDLNLAASLMDIYRIHSEGQEIRKSMESSYDSSLVDKDKNIDVGAYLDRTPSSIQKALKDVAEAIISHRSTYTKYETSSSEARSKEFVDALQFLSSNKELFLMLLQDPSSRLLQCLHNLYVSLGSPKLGHTEFDEQTKLKGMTSSPPQFDISFKAQKKTFSFLEEDKLVRRIASKLNESSHGLSRIVILKPTPARTQSGLISSSATSSPLSNHTNMQGQGYCDNPAHHFSLRELRRRLRLAITNNHKDTMSNTFGMSDSTKQFPTKSMSTSSTSTNYSYSERSEQLFIGDKETNPDDSECGMENDATHGINSFSYEKAKQHLMERLYSQEDDISHIVHKSESIRQIISYSEYTTSSHCPQEEGVSLLQKGIYSSLLQTNEQDGSSVNSDPLKKFKETTDLGNHSSREGIFSQELMIEGDKNMDVVVENQSLRSRTKNSSEHLDQEKSGNCSSEEPQSINRYHNPFVVEVAKPSILKFHHSLDNADEKEEKLSSQSVLESLLVGSTSPPHKIQKQDELSMSCSRILFEEIDTPSVPPTSQNRPQVALLDDKYERVSFIKVVLEASKLLTEESSDRWYMDESLLDTSILAEVGNSYCLTDDVVLLFDCVLEALLMIRDNLFSVDPSIAFIKHKVRPALAGTKLIQEVAKCIDSLANNEFPNTLDQVMMKDLERGSWMDLQCCSKDVALEAWNGLLDDLLEEVVFDMWL